MYPCQDVWGRGPEIAVNAISAFLGHGFGTFVKAVRTERLRCTAKEFQPNTMVRPNVWRAWLLLGLAD